MKKPQGTARYAWKLLYAPCWRFPRLPSPSRLPVGGSRYRRSCRRRFPRNPHIKPTILILVLVGKVLAASNRIICIKKNIHLIVVLRIKTILKPSLNMIMWLLGARLIVPNDGFFDHLRESTSELWEPAK